MVGLGMTGGGGRQERGRGEREQHGDRIEPHDRLMLAEGDLRSRPENGGLDGDGRDSDRDTAWSS